MIRSVKNWWYGVNDEGLYDVIADVMTEGAGLKVSEFTIQDVRIEPNVDFINMARDLNECYIHTINVP